MANDDDRGFSGFVRWVSKPPQSYVMYVIALILIWAVMFYAGTLNPKRTNSAGPAAVTTPKN